MSPRLGVGRPPRPAQRGKRRPSRPGPRRPGVAEQPRPSVPATKRREPRVVELPPSLTIKELAERLDTTPALVIKELLGTGVLATINQSVDYETAARVARSLSVEVVEKSIAPPEETQAEQPSEEGPQMPRPPVVTIMGHVDHGKTSLLDAIREANVAARETGGITQHIGAYQTEIHGQKITFLDTPGHEAFTAMRARGAHVTDIAVLVVAADDGVQPQTIEAIGHARAARVPIIVAINKADRLEANPDRVKQQLADAGLIVEEWGGDTITVTVSALQKQGIEQLMEMILLVAEMGELQANPNRSGIAAVVEAKLDKTRGPVATVLVQSGTLRVGDSIVVNGIYGKIRAMFNDLGKRVKRAGPSMPVEILGLSEVPQAGDTLTAVPDEKTARALAQEQARRLQVNAGPGTKAATLEDLSIQVQAGQIKDLNLILRTDVQGSIDPVRLSLERLSTDEVKVRFIHQGTGNVTESDVLLAQASNAIVVGFNIRVEPGARRLADSSGVDIRLYSIIYEVIEDIQKALTGLLEPKFAEVVDGHAEVRQVFKVGRTEAIAGCMITDGRVTRSGSARLIRDGAVIHAGRISSLRRFKDDVRELAAGYECGLGLEGFKDFQVGDIIEVYRKERVS